MTESDVEEMVRKAFGKIVSPPMDSNGREVVLWDVTDESQPHRATEEQCREALGVRETRYRLHTLREAIEGAMSDIASVCSHQVIYDIPGMPYDVRKCAACGRTSLI